MKAAVFHGPDALLGIEDVPDPTPEASDLVVRVRASGICGTDVHGASGGGYPDGTVMGHEFAGEVVEVGADACGDWSPGDRVCALPLRGCGACEPCLRGDPAACSTLRYIGVGDMPGAYAEYVRVGAHETVRLPDAVDFRTGAMIEPLAVGLHAVQQADLRHAENVLVVGAGPIGLAIALWARFFGAREVIVSERVESRLELAGSFGATGGIDGSKEDVAAAFARQAGAAPDVVFECVGAPGVLQECVGLVRPRGQIVVAGLCMQPDTWVPGIALVKEASLRFVLAYRIPDFRFIADMLASERVDPRAMITDVVGFDAFPERFEALKHPSTQCKVLLEL